jgi:hypothetical protein
MTEERLVTLQETWEIQVCDNGVNAYHTFETFHNEADAVDAFDLYKVRLVQKGLINVREK